ncbi:hypothetical protein [Pseudomonas mucidolens]|uniref:hypothetical protein n=1 Tax=Pseudomonas mucidolens TaxID=46679 RepID=UPI0030DC73B3
MQTTTNSQTLQPTPHAAEQSAVGSQAEHLTLLFLLQLIVIFAASRLISWIGTRCFGQTQVAGEILAGLVLGPSLLGYFFSGAIEQYLRAPHVNRICRHSPGGPDFAHVPGGPGV